MQDQTLVEIAYSFYAKKRKAVLMKYEHMLRNNVIFLRTCLESFIK